MSLFSIRPARLVAQLLAGLPAVVFVALGLAIAQHTTPGELVSRALAPATPSERVRRCIDAQDPHVQKIANAIRSITSNPVEQVAAIDWGGLNFISYSSAAAASLMTPTIAQLERERAERGWTTWRGDCEAQAVLAGSLCEALHLPYRVENNRYHVWIEAQLPEQTIAINANDGGSPRPMLGTATLDQAYVDAGLRWPDGKERYPTRIDANPPFEAGYLIGGIACGLVWIGLVVWGVNRRRC